LLLLELLEPLSLSPSPELFFELLPLLLPLLLELLLALFRPVLPLALFFAPLPVLRLALPELLVAELLVPELLVLVEPLALLVLFDPLPPRLVAELLAVPDAVPVVVPDAVPPESLALADAEAPPDAPEPFDAPPAGEPPDVDAGPEPFVPPEALAAFDGAALVAGASPAEAAAALGAVSLLGPAEGALSEALEPLAERALSEPDELLDELPPDELLEGLSAPLASVVVDPPELGPPGLRSGPDEGPWAELWAGPPVDGVPAPLASTLVWPPEPLSPRVVVVPAAGAVGGVLTELTESWPSAPGAPARNSGAAEPTDGTIEPSGRITDRMTGDCAAGSWLAAFSTKALPRFCTAANTGSGVGRPPSAVKPASEPTATIAPVAPASLSRGDPRSSSWWRGPFGPASRCAQPSRRRIAATERPIPILAA
jgi:hypothetical protein